VMGTVGYMSPEQVRGLPADHRSDIFSFGSILYEMLSGRRAFRGDSAAETMAAIAQKEPPDLESGGPDVPADLDRVVRHCLEKSPAERFQSAGDLAFALQSAVGPSARHETIASPLERARTPLVPILAAAAAALLAFALGWRLHRAPPAAPALRATFERLTDQPGVESQPNLSPDGKSFVYVSGASGNDDIYLLRIGGRNPVNLTADSPDDDDTPSFSPDGSQIAFRSERQGGGIFVMGATGESVKRLTDFGFNPSWSPDGKQVAVSTVQFAYPTDRSGTGELWAVDVATGTKRAVFQGSDAVQPSWSPHGKRIAFWGLRGQSGQRDIWTVAADGSQVGSGAVDVTNDAALDYSPTWSPDGHYLYFASDRGGTMNLWRVPIDESSGRVLGEPEAVTTPSSFSGWPSLSADGRSLVYASLEWRSTLQRTPFDPTRGEVVGSTAAVIQSTLPIRDHNVSPDGKRVAFTTAGREDLFVVGSDGSGFRRLTDDTFRDRGPSWSPGGERILFYSDRSGAYQIWSVRPDGSGLQQVTRADGALNYPVWSPDGSRFASANLRTAAWMVYDAAKGTAITSHDTPVREGMFFWPFSWSADGDSIVGVVWSKATGTAQGFAIYSIGADRYREIYRTGTQNFMWSSWLNDGRVLFRDKRGISLLDPRTGADRRLISVAGYTIGESLGVSKDNRSITYTETGTEGDIWLMRFEGGEKAGVR
jgi:Tol biopolymer transport system component